MGHQPTRTSRDLYYYRVKETFRFNIIFYLKYYNVIHFFISTSYFDTMSLLLLSPPLSLEQDFLVP